MEYLFLQAHIPCKNINLLEETAYNAPPSFTFAVVFPCANPIIFVMFNAASSGFGHNLPVS